MVASSVAQCGGGGGDSVSLLLLTLPTEHPMLTTKLENLMFARFSLMSSCFGKGMLSMCCCTLEACNFFVVVQHVLTIKRWS